MATQVTGTARSSCGTPSARGVDIAFAADAFVLKDGKMAVQTFAPKVEAH